MDKLKIVVLDASVITDIDEFKVFEKLGEISVFDKTQPHEVGTRIKDAEIVVTSKVKLNHNLEEAKKLKLICVTATGVNNVDLDYVKLRNIRVTNVARYSTESVAQHTFALLFYLLENLKYYDDFVKNGEYQQSLNFSHFTKSFNEINGKKWGIIGLGNIGKRVMEIARAFGCEVLYYSTSGKNNFLQASRLELDDLLKTSDFISIHSPLNAATKNLIDYNKIKLMKKNSILLNLGRGGIINESDLARSLDDEIILAAGIDVLEFEPINIDNPLLKIKNKDRLIITPHIGWASKEARKKLIIETYLNIESFLNGNERNLII